VQEELEGEVVKGNMMVPIDLLEPILLDLVKHGRRQGLPRPWLGVYATSVRDQVVITGLAQGGPADRAGVRLGDAVVEVGGHRVTDLADCFRRVWRLGPAGTSIPLTLSRDGAPVRVRVASIDRDQILHRPSLQ
jgi:S1-C subfamily serine protease